jgi:hypothetical protein
MVLYRALYTVQCAGTILLHFSRTSFFEKADELDWNTDTIEYRYRVPTGTVRLYVPVILSAISEESPKGALNPSLKINTSTQYFY